MPAVLMNAFSKGAGAIGRPTTLFLWEDDPSEDATFAVLMTVPPRVKNVAIDRSGTEPVIQWDDYNNNRRSKPIGPAGTHWYYDVATTTGSFIYEPGIVDVTGWWVSDEYGRPFDLNDLLGS